MNVLAIVNTIRANNSSMYQERIPVATQENYSEVGNAIINYEPDFNEFTNALVNRICFTEVSNRRYKNKLAVLKKGGKPYGTDIEEIYVNPVSGVQYDGNDVQDMLKITKPDVKTIFHRMNRQSKYPVSITVPQLQKAFTSFNEMEKLITAIINAMYSGDEIDEFLLMRNLISEGIKDNKIVSHELEYDGGAETSKDLIKLLKTISGDMEFPDKQFNGYNKLNAEGITAGSITPCTTWTPKENQIVLIRTDIDANTDVEVLAKAFNMEKTDFLKRKFVVNSFGDEDTLAVICDEKLFEVRDDLYVVRSFENGSNLATNWWLHHWQTLSLSLFANAVAIKKKVEG